MLVRVIKHKRELSVIKKSEIIFSCKVSLGRSPKGPKRCEGDGKTPEGRYYLLNNILSSPNEDGSQKKYPKSFKITYPNGADMRKAQKEQLNPGGDILIHGITDQMTEHILKRVHEIKDHWQLDWTQGCIGITNPEMNFLYTRINFGSPIEILP